MIMNILKLSKNGWHVFLNGSGEQQLIAGMAIGAIIGLEKAVITICKSKAETKELIKKGERLNAESDRVIKQAEEDFAKAKEAEEYLEQVKRELEEAKKNDPMKKEVDRLLRRADRLLQED